MRKYPFLVAMVLLAFCSEAGAGGVVIEGVLRTWDEIATIALRASGRATSKESISATSKVVKTATEKYGDDVAKAAMKGGVEIAEQTAKKGRPFFSVIKRAGNDSPKALRALAQNADEALTLTAKYGDVVLKLNSKSPGVFSRGVAVVEKSGVKGPTSAIRAIADLPAEDIPRVIGALEKNPQVSQEILAGVEHGGKAFVDRLFALNGKQILAGTLGSAAVVGTIHAAAPVAAEGGAVVEQTQIARDGTKRSSERAQKEFVQAGSGTTDKNRISVTRAFGAGVIMLVCVAGMSLLLFPRLKGRK